MTTPRTRTALLAALASLALLPATAPAQAAPVPAVLRSNEDPDTRKKTVDSTLATQRSNLAITTASLATANAKLTTTTSQLTTANTAYATAASNLTAAETAYSQAKAAVVTADKEAVDARIALVAAEAAKTKAEGQVKSTETGAASARTRVGSIARRAYMTGGFSTPSTTLTAITAGGDTTALLGATTMIKLNNRALSALAVQRAEQVASVDRLDGVQRRVAAAKKTADAALVKATQARTDAETARTKAASERTAKAKAKDALEALKKRQSADIAALNTKKSGELASIKAMEAESNRLTAVLKARAAAAAAERRRQAAAAAAAAQARQEQARQEQARQQAPAPAPAADPAPAPAPAPVPASVPVGVLDMPAPASAISSGFGYRIHPVLGLNLLHAGQDFAIGCGAPVYAARGGQVIAAGVDDSYGNRVIIDHGYVGGHDLTTLYAHLTSISVSGGSVQRGQLIGYSGTTGRSTGCHLHFEARQDGTPVDPMTLF